MRNDVRIEVPVMPALLQHRHAQQVELESIADRVEIAPQVRMPRLGLGTSQALPGRVEQAVREALRLGYRLIDTAKAYNNESAIGSVIAQSRISRAELFITSKLWADDQGYRRTIAACKASLQRLNTSYLDLYLIHWPEPEKTLETWAALEDLHKEGLVRAIGVSNFMVHDLEQLMTSAQTPPAVNQFELHPWRQRPWLQDKCRELGITIQAWAPVMRGRASLVRELSAIGRHHDKTGAQVAIRWVLQSGFTTVAKSIHPERLRENMEVFDFELSRDEMAQIDALDRDEHVG